jgi:ATP-dependent Clp protease ATP-binding subunit ClpA
MRRVVQRAVESNVAKLILSGRLQPGQTVQLTREHVASILDKKQQADDIVGGTPL